MRQQEFLTRIVALSSLHRVFITVSLTLSLAILSACGGGGGGGGVSSTTTTTISGTALAPSGVIAQLSNQSFIYALNEFLFPSARADITGLDPVTGALVELIEVNDAGVQVGPVLASTTTSITGDYKLALPAGVNLAANLVVRITGSGVNLDAMVVQTNVNITPLSEYLLRKFITRGASLATLNVSEVAALSGHAAQFDVAATSDLTSMFAALETQLGSFVDDAIIAIDSTPGKASTVAGDIHHGAYEMGFEYRNDSIGAYTYGRQRTSAGAGQGTLTDGGGANIGAIDQGETNADAGQQTNDNTNYMLDYEINIGQGGQVLTNVGTVDGGGNINLTFPFQEDINPGDTYGFRSPPSTQNLYASGVAGVLVSTGINSSAAYRLVDTNGDGIPDAVDPNAYVGHMNNFSLDVVAPQASGMTQSALAGNYGTVALGNMFTGTRGISIGYTFNTTLDASGGVTINQKDAEAVTRTPDSSGTATFEEATDTTPLSGKMTVSSNGQLTYTQDGVSTSFFGFASNNAEFVLVDSSGSDGTPPNYNYVTNEISLSVRKPSGTPNLAGRTYRLIGIAKQMDTSGQIQFQRLRGDDDRLIFSGDDTQVSISYHGLDLITRHTDNDDFTTTTDTSSGTIDHAVTIGSDGAISFTQTVTGTGGHTREWRGFVSASTNIIVLRSIDRADDGSRYGMGIYVAVPVM